MQTGNRIKKRRLELGLTVDDLAKHLNKNRATIYRYESNEIENMPANVLEPLAQVLKTTPAYLMGWEFAPKNSELEYIGTAEAMSSYKYIPDPVAAGSPQEILGQDFSEIYIPNNLLGKYAGNHKLILMKTSGNSMNKIIPNGSLVAILPYSTTFDVEDGDIVVFRDENYCYSVKRFYKYENKIILRPESNDPAYTDIVIDIEKHEVEILGKVVMYNVILD